MRECGRSHSTEEDGGKRRRGTEAGYSLTSVCLLYCYFNISFVLSGGWFYHEKLLRLCIFWVSFILCHSRVHPVRSCSRRMKYPPKSATPELTSVFKQPLRSAISHITPEPPLYCVEMLNKRIYLAKPSKILYFCIRNRYKRGPASSRPSIDQ